MITMHHFKLQFHPMKRSAEKQFLQSFLPLTNVWDANTPMAKLKPAIVYFVCANAPNKNIFLKKLFSFITSD